jgi:murein DD-endopeptidase MepM/ murein hydrolase activator NlpD
MSPSPRRVVATVVVLVVVLVVAAVLPAVSAPPSQAAGERYRPPVDAEIVDRFRPPSRPYGPGNLGIDYATAPGDPVRAARSGVVTFAGQVGGDLIVVVRHPDGLRTTSALLGALSVRRGDDVRQGQTLGTAGDRPLHFGVRAGAGATEVYLDPELLFAGDLERARLVPN